MIKPVYVIDFNNDGILEILSAGRVYKRINTDPLTYEQSVDSFYNSSSNVEIADMNTDGFMDILSYGENLNTTIWINDNTGVFSENNSIALPHQESLKLLAGDMDYDNHVDILFSNNDLLKSDGMGNYHKIENFIDGVNKMIPHKLVNLNNDGYPDLYMTIGLSTGVVFPGNGPYGFNNSILDPIILGGSTANFSLFDYFSSLSGDFNADGLEDFITIPFGALYIFDSWPTYFEYQPFSANINPVLYAEKVKVWLNYSTGLSITFPFTDFTIPIYAFKQALNSRIAYSRKELIDIDNDGIQELLTYSYYDSIEDVRRCGPKLCHGEAPFYISNVGTQNHSVNTLNIFNSTEMKDYNFVISGDFNNDGMDDIYVVTNGSSCQVFLNSATGFNVNNVLDFSQGSLCNDDIPNFYGWRIATGKVIDFNRDGYNDIWLGESSIYINDNGNQFVKQDLNFTDYQKTIDMDDVNNDGFVDVTYIGNDDRVYVLYGQEDMSTASSVVMSWHETGEVDEMIMYDFDFDGLQDVYIKVKDRNRLLILKNNGNNFILQETHLFSETKPLSNIAVVDLNNDGIAELISTQKIEAPYDTSVKFMLYIYQLNSQGKFSTIYQSEIPQFTNYIFHDFDGDSLIDVSVSNKILFSQDLNFLTGLSYDPNHSGHGFSIENIGPSNLFYTVFYTYDNEGNSEWFSDLGLFQSYSNNYWDVSGSGDQMIRYQYDYDIQSAFKNTSDSYKGFLTHEKCTDTYGDISLDYSIGVNFIGNTLSEGNWCSRPIVGHLQRPDNNLSGLWWAGNEDSGWGWSVSLVEREQTTDIVLVLYYYDGQGNPRWLIGQQTGFEAGQEITIEMKMATGYARDDEPRAIDFTTAGSINLTLNQASNNILSAGRMSIDVTYPGAEGGHWVRDNIPIALFSNPR